MLQIKSKYGCFFSNFSNKLFNQTKQKQIAVNLNAVKEKISCLIWENEWKGADLSMLEISSYIIENADKTTLSTDYFYLGCFFSILISRKF